MPGETLFFDIDYTLTEFSHDDGIAALGRELLGPSVSVEAADFVASYVDRCFHAVLQAGKSGSNPHLRQFVSEIVNRGTQVEGWVDGANLEWSRELWIERAAQEAGLIIPTSRIIELADSYWQGIKECTIMYDEVPEVLRWLAERRWRIVLVTSSDGRLYATDENALAYDPVRAMQAKMGRLHPYLIPAVSRVFVGDPIGKPHEQFWQRVLREIGFRTRRDWGVMVGDSYHTDVAPMSQWSIRGVLLDRNGSVSRRDARLADTIITNLHQLPTVLAELGFEK